MTPEKLEHEDLIYLARLLGNHVTHVDDKSRIGRISTKLLNYAERTGEWDAYDHTSLPPLNLAASSNEFYPGQFMFRVVEK